MFGKWISNGTAAPFYARRRINIRKPVVSAAAKVCGLGQFLFWVNGKKAGDHELDPAWTDYRKWIQYVCFDVTEELQPGENIIGAEVGNGWFIKSDEHYTFSFPSFMPPNPNPYTPFGKQLVLALELTVRYEDGTEERFDADEDFKVKAHPVVMSNVYGSETIDGRLVRNGWSEKGFDDEDWEQAVVVSEEEKPGGILREQFQPPVKVIRSCKGCFLYSLSGDHEREVYDFGQNMSGILDLEVSGKCGDMVRIFPAEKLGEDGDVDQVAKGWTTVDSCITYIVGTDDCWEHVRMKFTYFAGRYIAVEKIFGDSKTHLIKIRNLRADAISSAWKTDGSFSCDDHRYEQIYDMIEKTVEANMMGVHTDCPTIERFAWQEPNHLMAPSIFFMKDGRLLWEKFLTDMRYAQHTKEDVFFDYEGNKVFPGDGLMPSQCPCYIPNVLPVPGMGSFYDIIPWGSTCILGTWQHYQFYGDPQIIKDNYEAGLRYFRFEASKRTKDGFICHGLGDWGNPRNELARENIETAFLYADAKILEEFAGILGREEDIGYLSETSEEIRDNYNERLLAWDPVKQLWCYRCYDHPGEIFLTQASQALPLFWDMVPAEKKDDVVKAFRNTLEREQAFICGEIGLPYVIQTARKYDMNDLIGRFVLREEHPGYYAFILDGETTLGEYWEKNPRSHCHDMMGHIIEWYYNGIAGILCEEPGFKKIRIFPHLPETVHECFCSYHSVRGEICVQIRELEDQIVLDIKVPEESEVKVDISGLQERNENVVVSYR